MQKEEDQVLRRSKPNFVYLHVHDAGRWIQPYGFPVETPNLMQFAKEATLFRKAYAVSPTCGPSRAALLTGEFPHQVGMFGLPGSKGWAIDDYSKHLTNQFNEWGYETVLAGVQHEADHADFSCVGYQRILENESPARERAGEFYPETISKVESYLATRTAKEAPFFLSIGIDEPHRDNIPRPELNLLGDSRRFSKTRFYDPDKLDYRYTAPPTWMPDLPGVRKDMESFRKGVSLMDEYIGRVLDALEQSGWAKSSWVIVTTDHGIEFPGGKKTLSDAGLGVMLMIRGPEGSTFPRGHVVEPMVTQLDLWPTFCEVLGKPPPERLQGKSLLPLVYGKLDSLHHCVFGEQTEHGDMEPMRSVRTERYKYVLRHYKSGPRLRHDGPTTDILESLGWYGRNVGKEELYDLYLDPTEACNRCGEVDYEEVRKSLKRTLLDWMKETDDIFRKGKLPQLPTLG